MEVNQFLGGYQIRSHLQTSQKTQVFEVVEPQSKRHFAMKLLLPEWADDKTERESLFNEAEIGIKMRHENVVQIVKVDKSLSNPFFVMEFFPAGSLRKRIFDKDWDFLKTNMEKILRQAATGLAYMNASGYLHCDIKPDNILVNAVGDLKLIDFAISKKMQKGFFARMFYKKKKAQGTPSFMSPEQLRGEMLDERADVYSFGATMFELLTKRKPFTGSTPGELMNNICTKKADSPQSYNSELTDEVSQLVMRLLAKNRDNRPKSFHEVLMELKKIRIYKVPPKSSDK